MCYSEQYMEVTAQQVDSVIVAGMECVTVNIIWNFVKTNFYNHKKYIYFYFEFCIGLCRMCLILQCINSTATQVL